MRRRFEPDYLRREFERLGAELQQPTEGYLIGGGSMSFRDLKVATKDIDLVVTKPEAMNQIRSALKGLAYREVQSPGQEYFSLGAQAILENDDGCRFDIFVQQVVGTLVFSEGMQQRSEEFLQSGNLTVSLVSPEDVFLFKSVAGRTDDIEDMSLLVQGGLDFEIIEEEVEDQADLLGEELFITDVNESLIELEDRFGVTTSIRSVLTTEAERIYRELEVLMAFEELTTISSLADELDRPEQDVEERLDSLEAKGVVQRDGPEIRKIRERP